MDENPYYVESQNGQFSVLDETDQVVMACGDEANAAQYATLMNQAYRRGYKAGYRTAKRSEEN